MPHRPALRIGPSWWLLGLPLLFFLFIPLVALVWQNELPSFLTTVQSPQVHQAISLSLKTSLWTTGISVFLGIPIALVLTRVNFPFRKVIDVVIDLPMVLPPAVAGVALLIAFGRNGLLGSVLFNFGIQIPFTQVAVIMAQIFVAAPLFLRSAIVGLSRVAEELEEAALLDGASTWQMLRYVTLPIAGPALVGGAVLTWARAIGEFGATIIFAGNLPGQTQTMPLAIYLGFELDLNVALTLSVILMGTSFIVLALVRFVISN